MQQLHARHLAPFPGCLDAVGEKDQARLHLERAKQGQAQTQPACSECFEIQARAVEEMKEAVIGLAGEIEHAHETGDAGVVCSAAQGGQSQQHPEKGAYAGASRAQCEYGLQPIVPQKHEILAVWISDRILRLPDM